jgi:signal transduction histidine kinase
LQTRSSPRAVVSARLARELRAARAEWSSLNRWTLLRKLLLPALVVWGMAGVIADSPWRGAEALLVVVALLGRFTWPSAALLLVVVSVDTFVAGMIAVPVIAYRLGRRATSLGRAAAVFALASVPLTLKAFLAVQPATDGSPPWGVAALVAGLYVGVGLILPGMVGALARERARRVDTLLDRNAILERAQQLGDEQARMQERARIAGEMHDLLGHRLSLISLHAGALEVTTRQTAPELSEQAAVMRTTARTALDELREVLGILKLDSPSENPDGQRSDGHGDETGTRADVAALVLASQRAGVDVGLTWDGEDTAGLDGTARRALHRVVREALTNVHNHAPGAAAQVLVEHRAAVLRVEVRNGLRPPGAPRTPGTSMGLVGLRERVRLAGGTMRAYRDGERAEFVVSAVLPLLSGAAGDDLDATDTTNDQADLVRRQTAEAASAGDTGSHIGAEETGSTDTMRKPAKITLFVILGFVVLCCGGGVIGAKLLERKANKESIPAETYNAVRVGHPEKEVREAVGETSTLAKEALSNEPPTPTGAKCVYTFASKPADGDREVYRFCFTGGQLVEKQTLRPGTGDAPTGK